MQAKAAEIVDSRVVDVEGTGLIEFMGSRRYALPPRFRKVVMYSATGSMAKGRLKEDVHSEQGQPKAAPSEQIRQETAWSE